MIVREKNEVSRRIKHVTVIDVIHQGRKRDMIEGSINGFEGTGRVLAFMTGEGEIIPAILSTNNEEELDRLTRRDGKRGFRALDGLAHKVGVACVAEFMNTRSFDATIKASEIPDFLSVKVNIAELAKLMGRSETNKKNKKARNDIVDAANALFKWDIINFNEKGKRYAFHVLGGEAITRNGWLRVSFTAEFYKLLASKEATFTTYPLELFKLTDRAYSIAYDMALNVYRTGNYSREQINGEGKEYHVVKLHVAKLLRWGGYPDYSLPSNVPAPDDHIAQAKAERSQGHWRDEVKEPFEKDLEKIREAGLIADRYYSRGSHDGKEIKLTDEELEALENGKMSFTEYSNLFITFYWALDVDTEAIDGRIRKARQKARQKSRNKEKH